MTSLLELSVMNSYNPSRSHVHGSTPQATPRATDSIPLCERSLMAFGKIRITRQIAQIVGPVVRHPTLARRDVDTDEVSGQLQFEILKREGCVPSSRVLEVGCGCLHAGRQLIRYLDESHYVGVDPNAWLVQTARDEPDVEQLVTDKRARFLHVNTFDASSLGVAFDYVLSHSVLSHCAHWQLDQFLQGVAKVLAPTGRVLASIYLAEGNAYGSAPAPNEDDSRDEEWVYPGISRFKLSTVEDAAARHGLTAVTLPDYTALITSTRPHECHDWMIFTPTTD